MTRAKSKHENIHAALKKLKDEANEKEIQIIELVASLYEQFQDTKEKAMDSVDDTVSTVNTSVHLYPWRYIGGAAILSFLVGIFCCKKGH